MVRTDLIIEAHEVLLQTSRLQEIEGIKSFHESSDGIDVSLIEIVTPEAAQKIGKSPGKYITIEAPGLRDKNSELEERLAAVVQAVATPPAPGRRCHHPGCGAGQLECNSRFPWSQRGGSPYVTRHIKAMHPDKIGPGFRNVCAIAPGVLGLTEKPVKLSLACTAPQAGFGHCHRCFGCQEPAPPEYHHSISDTGIYPGSGVGSRGQGITPQTLGIPVLAIGVPTVVDAATLANDVLELVVKAVHKQAGVGSDVSQLLSLVEELESTDKKQLIREVLNPEVGMLMVTPKEVDRLLNDISGVLANGLNAALHPRVAAEFFH